MTEELEKTCENCKYEFEDGDDEHCRHCIHNAEEHFEAKEMNEKEIRNKAIDECLNEFANWYGSGFHDTRYCRLLKQMKGSEENG